MEILAPLLLYQTSDPGIVFLRTHQKLEPRPYIPTPGFLYPVGSVCRGCVGEGSHEFFHDHNEATSLEISSSAPRQVRL